LKGSRWYGSWDWAGGVVSGGDPGRSGFLGEVRMENEKAGFLTKSGLQVCF